MAYKYTVYKHTAPNGKVYIGITCQNPIKRWSGGLGYSDNEHFYRAILKYGWDNIKHEILYSGLTKEEACQKEIELIAQYKSNNPDFGYNKSIGGDVCIGYHHSEKTKQRLSEIQKTKIGEKSPHYGKHVSEENKQRLREINLGKRHSEQTREKMKGRIPWNKGKSMSVETRTKISNTLKRRKVNDD